MSKSAAPSEPHILKREKFDPVKFLGEDYGVYKQVGTRTNSSLYAEQINFKHYIKEDETGTSGDERLKRIIATPADIQLDAQDFMALWNENDHATLEWLHATKKIHSLSCWGTIMQDTHGRPSVLHLFRFSTDGSWHWDCLFINGVHWTSHNLVGTL